MSSLVEIVEAMRDAIETALDGSDPPVQVSAYRIINPTGPTVDIYPADPFTDDTATGFTLGADEANFTLRARVGTADIEESQRLLLQLMDDQDDLSVVAPLYADQTLDGACSSLGIQGPSGHTIYEETASAAAMLGVDWRVKVIR